MNWADLLDWTLRILGGLASLVVLALLVTLLGSLGKVFAWLGKANWRLTKWLSRLVRLPLQALLEAVDHSALFAFALFPFTWLLEKLWFRPRLKRLAQERTTSRQVGDHERSTAWPEPPPWNEAPSLAYVSAPMAPQRPIPAPLVELVRLWERGFDLRPIRDLPGSEAFYMSYFVYPQLWEPDAPSILVTKPFDDQPRWRLSMQSGKDVLCIDIDEAEFLVWWRQTLFNEKGEMDLAGWLRVSDLTIGYCEAHRYPIWRFAHENPTLEERLCWREGLIAELVPYHDAVLYVRTLDTSARIALWPGEIVGRYGGGHRPSRNWMTNGLNPKQTDWTANLEAWIEASQPIRLLDLLQSEAGADALVTRMNRKSMPPYSRDELTQTTPLRWVWAQNSSDPVCLLLEPVPDGDGVKVRFPSAWIEDARWQADGPFLFLQHRYIVTSEDSLRGLIDLDGRFTVPCRYAYLDDGLGNGECFEAATTLDADSRGEMPCDLIDGDGRRINPPGLIVLAGTLARDGCVVSTEDDSKSLRRDWMDTTGAVRNGESVLTPDELRWAAVGELRYDRRLVRCPDSGLWGYLDKTGAVAIPPAFHQASWFDDGLAKVGIEPGNLGLLGLDGSWHVPPVWVDIWPESRQCYVVENEQGEFGAINPAGEVIVPLLPRAELAQGEDRPGRHPWQYDDDPVEQVMHQWRKSLSKRVDAAKIQDSLASLEGVFDSNARTRDLMEAGVWFMPVRVLRDQGDGLLQPKAGETGHIFAEYPVSLSIFDLSVEAPVAGLASAPQAIVGVQWRDLTRL